MIEEGLENARGRASSAHVRLLLVHELVHAMEYKRFKAVWRSMQTASVEQQQVWRALIEGSAQVVTRIVGEKWGMTDEVDDHIEMIQDDAASVPGWEFAYVGGYAFMKAVYDRHGRSGLDYVFTHPPVSTADVADPRTWLAEHDTDIRSFMSGR